MSQSSFALTAAVLKLKEEVQTKLIFIQSNIANYFQGLQKFLYRLVKDFVYRMTFIMLQCRNELLSKDLYDARMKILLVT